MVKMKTSWLKPAVCAAFALVVASCEGPPLPPKKATVSTTPPPSARMMAQPPVVQAPAASLGYQDRIPANATPVKVALMVPMTGESAQLGAAMLDAATLALYDQYFPLKPGQARANVVLMPRDVGDSISVASLTAQEVIKEGAAVIVGPLFSPSVMAVGPVASKASIPVLSFSNTRGAAAKGVYVLGFSPEDQVRRVTEYAQRSGIGSFGLLAPSDAYGKAVAESLDKVLKQRGSRASPIEYYARGNANIKAAVERLAKAYASKPFDALFLAEGAEGMPELMKALSDAGLDGKRVKLLGTGLWDEASVQQIPGLQGAWFASATPSGFNLYARRFRSAYGYDPPRLSALAYDTVAMVTALALEAGGANYAEDKLTAKLGYEGLATGRLRLNADGTVERALAVLEVQPGQFKVVDTAPRVLQ